MKPLQGRNEKGEEHNFNYLLPSLSQCHSCHKGGRFSSDFKPLGPRFQRLNRSVSDGRGHSYSQLDDWFVRWSAAEPSAVLPVSRSFELLPADITEYLDVNCGHCHNPGGLAASSGLYLDRHETDLTSMGVCKPPVASGGDQYSAISYDVEPGDPKASYLVQRMASQDVQIKMPELGRHLVDARGLEKISRWIEQLPIRCH